MFKVHVELRFEVAYLTVCDVSDHFRQGVKQTRTVNFQATLSELLDSRRAVSFEGWDGTCPTISVSKIVKFRNTTVTLTKNFRHMTLKDLPHVNDGIALTSTLQGVELEVGESIPVVVS